MNPNWERWIHASLLTYFTNFFKKDPSGLFLQIEGQDRLNTGADGKPLQDWAELRWDGPASYPYGSCTYLEVEVNFVVNSAISRDDTYKHKKLVGLVQSSFANSIQCLKYGNGPDDDNTLLGCLQLRIDDRQPIGTNYFGQTAVDILIEQSTIEGKYRMIL